MYFRVPYADGSTLCGPNVTSHEFSTDKNEPTCMVEQSLTVIWEHVSAAVKYNVYWAEVGYEDDPEYEEIGIVGNTATISNNDMYIDASKGYTDYMLNIVAVDSNGIEENSYYYIRILKSTIEAPVVISPYFATNDDGELPSFDDDLTITWNAVEGAVSYTVRIFDFYKDSYSELYSYEGITEATFEIPIDDLYEGGQFKLVVKAYDQYGNSMGSKYYFVVGEADYIGITVDNWNPSYEGGYKFTYVETIGAWTATASDSWIIVNTTSGTGADRVKISVTENPDSFARTGNVIFKNSNSGYAILSITQAANGSTNEGIVKITSPSQGDTVEKDVITVKWTCKYGYDYFNLILKDLTDNKVVYSENTIVNKYRQIPASYIKSGHTYQLTIEQYYQNVKNSESSIIFKVEGNVTPDYDDDLDDGDDFGNTGDSGNTGDNGNIGEEVEVCDHIIFKKVLADTEYTNLLKNTATHEGYYLYNKVCMICGVTFDSEKVEFAGESHYMNNGLYCDCGFTFTSAYSSWTATNNTENKVIVYQTPESITQYGYIHPSEEVKVLAECCGRYLIQYNLDNGSGVKHGYVNINSLGEKEIVYSIHIDCQYFDDDYNNMVVEKNTYYQIYIQNNLTNELFKYGTDGMVCVSSNEDIVTVGSSGTMVIRSTGTANIQLMKDGKVLDTVTVFGCVENSRITNYSATKDSELFSEGFAPNCRLRVFNYESMFVADKKWPGGGYYYVTFDVYNDVPTVFCVASFTSDGALVSDGKNIQQQLINGYSAGMLEEMIGAFVHIEDLFNGNLTKGETESGQTKTPVELKVPLGGYVDFLTLANSEYMIYANVFGGIVVTAMQTAEAWVEYIGLGTDDMDLDTMTFSEALLGKIKEDFGKSATQVIGDVIKLIMDTEDYMAMLTDIMGYLSNYLTLEDLFRVLMDCCNSSTREMIDSMLNKVAEKGLEAVLTKVPLANAIKGITDIIVSSLQFAVVLKDVAAMANITQDYLIIRYPTTPIY